MEDLCEFNTAIFITDGISKYINDRGIRQALSVVVIPHGRLYFGGCFFAPEGPDLSIEPNT